VNITNFKTHLLERGYPENFIQTTLSEVTFRKRKTKQQNLHSTLCNAMLPSNAERKTKIHEQLAFYKTATIA